MRVLRGIIVTLSAATFLLIGAATATADREWKRCSDSNGCITSVDNKDW